MRLFDKLFNTHAERELYAKKGQIVTCVNCKKDVYEFTKDIYVGDYREADQVKGINGFPSPKDGERTECPSCQVLLWL